MSNNFCAMPWHHTCVKTNGDYAVCCLHTQPHSPLNINTHTEEQWKASHYLDQVKQAFLDGTKHPGCKTCWQAEEQNLPSYRQRTKLEYEILGVDLEDAQPNVVEIDLGNTCNLKCLMCGPTSSSSILKEWRLLGEPDVPNQKDYMWSDLAFENLDSILQQSPKILNVRGGEPMYEKRLLKLLQQLDSSAVKNTVLHITTNATTWNSQWEEVLAKFKMTRFMFSVDAVGNYYEYIRHPGNWNQVQQNIANIKQMPNTKCLVHAVVMNLNILNFDQLVNWCRDQDLYLDLDKLTYPQCLQFDNLPANLKEKAIDVCNTVIDNPNNVLHIKEFTQNVKTVLENNNHIIDDRWADFLNYICPRDNLRNNSYTTVIS